MEIKEYQELSTRTMREGSFLMKSLNCALGMSGEVGEVIDMIKKSTFQGHELNKPDLVEELGDVMFYVCNLATIYHIDMSKVLQCNVDKLRIRFPEGFSEEASKQRADHNGGHKHEKRVQK